MKKEKVLPIVINSLFACLFCYTATAIAFIVQNITSTDTIKDYIQFIIFVMVWITACIWYNYSRFKKEGKTPFFMKSILIPLGVVVVVTFFAIVRF